MKTKTIQFVIAILIAILFNINRSYSQATSWDPLSPAPFPNQPFAPGLDFLGWAAPVVVPLNIRHDGTNNIDLYTGGPGFRRMTILGTATATPGHVGIGLNHTPSNDILDIKPDAAPAGTNTGLGLFN